MENTPDCHQINLIIQLTQLHPLPHLLTIYAGHSPQLPGLQLLAVS